MCAESVPQHLVKSHNSEDQEATALFSWPNPMIMTTWGLGQYCIPWSQSLESHCPSKTILVNLKILNQMDCWSDVIQGSFICGAMKVTMTSFHAFIIPMFGWLIRANISVITRNLHSRGGKASQATLITQSQNSATQFWCLKKNVDQKNNVV